MASFTIRVELHGASETHYEFLHRYMASAGFRRTVTGVTPAGVAATWKLPTAEYDIESEDTAFALRDKVKTLADAARPGAWVLVTKVAERAWSTEMVKV